MNPRCQKMLQTPPRFKREDKVGCAIAHSRCGFDLRHLRLWVTMGSVDDASDSKHEGQGRAADHRDGICAQPVHDGVGR